MLEAYGGVMSKLPAFLSDEKLESYTHLKTDTNLDFVPGKVCGCCVYVCVKSL